MNKREAESRNAVLAARNLQVVAALKVIALTPSTAQYLQSHDPKALAQVIAALGLTEADINAVIAGPKLPPVADLAVGGGGTVYTVIAGTDAGRDWLKENFLGYGRTHNWLGGSLVVEHRFIADIVEGARADGLIVR